VCVKIKIAVKEVYTQHQRMDSKPCQHVDKTKIIILNVLFMIFAMFAKIVHKLILNFLIKMFGLF